MRRCLISACIVVMAVAVTSGAPNPRQPQKTATQFYMEYRAAFAKAKKMDDILPYMAAKNRAQAEAAPAAEREKMFGMVKMMDQYTNLKVVKEAPTADGATLTVEAVDADKKKATATVNIVKEKGEWKLGGENWSS